MSCKYCSGSTTEFRDPRKRNAVVAWACGDGWGFHSQSRIVIDPSGAFRIMTEDTMTRPVEFCPKCGSKLEDTRRK